MDEKSREPGSHSPAPTVSGGSSVKSGESPATEPPPARRRGKKRKSTSLSGSGSSSAPPKRHAREKAAAASAAAAAGFSAFLPPTHNGPLTRARQLSDSNAALSSALNIAKNEQSMAAMDSTVADGREEVKVIEEDYQMLEAAIEAEFEAIRSRDRNAHVVPVAAGWFSWTNIHPLEKQALRSFFNGKSESRTPETYMEIRNWIMKRFHANPSMNIELNDLSSLSIGDLDARQEVMEFLDHWGLINYHPFPSKDPANIDDDPNTDVGKTEKTDTLIEKLYLFENEKSYPQMAPRANASTLAMPTGLFPESAIAEELARQEGPAVEYHCNSCSGDCSRKRYHCQKQADFDLCTECYNNGKFGSGMCPSDFILMEPGDSSGASGGKWTDQETLLLLEALELFKENWNEIAEHVATKTKAQCILHFLQMPIEDSFLDYDDTKDVIKGTIEPTSNNHDLSVPKDNSEASEGKTSKDESEPADSENAKLNSEPPESRSCKDETRPPERKTDTDTAQPVSTLMETSNVEDVHDRKVTLDKGDNIVMKALKDAFDVVDSPLTADDKLSFAEAGNPVMALAAFLTRLVEPGVAIASARSSLKSMSKSSSGSQLAARHCFLLEDPPADKKDQTGAESVASGNTDQNPPQLVNQENKNDKENNHNEANFTNQCEKSISLCSGTHSTDHQIHEKRDSTSGDYPELPSGRQGLFAEKLQVADKSDEEKSLVAEKSIEEKSLVADKSDREKTEVAEKSHEEQSENAEKPGEQKSQVVEKSHEERSENVENPGEQKSQVAEKPGEKVLSESQDRLLQNERCPTNTKEQDDSASKVNLPSSANESGKLNAVVEAVQHTEAPKDVDMQSIFFVPCDKMEGLLPDSAVGVRSDAGEDKMEVDKTGQSKSMVSTEAKDDPNVAKLKRAAVATLSAAAVKTKLLANQEEDEIRQLAALLIEKQMRKLEIKLSFFTEMDNAIMRVKEQLDRSRQKLFNERAQIIASRLGLSASSSRVLPSSFPMNRMPPSLLNSMMRPSMSMAAQRPPMPRPVMTSVAPPTTNVSAPPEVVGGAPMRPTPRERPPSFGTN